MALPKKLFATVDLPVLTALLQDAGLQLVDIGGRGSAFYPLITLAPFAEYFTSEADSAEAARLTASLPRDAWRRVTVFDRAIASRPGHAGLRLTAEPGMSSLLDPDLEVAGRFHLASKFAVTAIVDVPTMSLDDAAAHYGFTGAAFIKLDTQGTELDILQSGPRLVADSLLGVHVEVSFRPFYRDQPVFADVDAYLRAHGFSLSELQRTMLRRAGYREAVYSKRTVVWAHCLYFREPKELLRDGTGDLRRRLSRLLGLAIAFQHFDLAFELAAVAAPAGMVGEAEVPHLVQEIERAADVSMRYLLQKRAEGAAAAGSPAEELTAPSRRDKSLRE